ncbi:hypothetical protein ABXS73_04495 [Intestinimonas butyriciproducens]|uniref:hypothetical protein n=1 Tax=Intestinimonas butyriciproducens TaxID=1297617 RepID=UPI0034E3A31D
MRQLYAGITTHTFPIPMIIVHIISRITDESMQILQETLDILAEGVEDPRYPKDFPWQTARIVVYYHGLEKRPAEFSLKMPDGREVRAHNMNPRFNKNLPAVYRGYADVMEVARQALLHGESIQDTCAKAWAFFKGHPDLAGVEFTREKLESDLRNWEEMLMEEGYIPVR